ncbi:DUF3592 domain-containing protein [Streptomyces morookaense]|uniref:DUF3592 domain-containing protein n=1 Tax=Streptomyces morookaense TaxID=1970 RepID=UPI0033E74CCB
MIGAAVYLCMTALMTAASAYLWRRVIRLTRLKKDGVTAEGRCINYEFGESSAAAIFEYPAPEGRSFTVTSDYRSSLPFQVGETSEIIFNPSDPSQAAVADHLKSELRTLRLTALAMTAVPLLMSAVAFIA